MGFNFMDLARSWVWALMLKSEAIVKISEDNKLDFDTKID